MTHIVAASILIPLGVWLTHHVHWMAGLVPFFVASALVVDLFSGRAPEKRSPDDE